MATGENTGTWGNVTNDNLGTALEQAIVETATVTFASANVTLTLTDTNAKQNARALRLNLAGTTAGARDLIVPAIQKPYLVNNGTADTITVKVSGQTGIAVPAGKSMLLYNNGTDVGLAFNRVVADLIGNGSGITAMNASEITTGSLANARTTASSSNGASTIVARDASGNFTANVITANGSAMTALNASNISSGTLAVGRGGTGTTTLNNNAVIIGNTTGAVKFVDPGTDGNVLTSNGTAWVSEAISAGGNYVFREYSYASNPTPFTWTKPAGLKAVRVTVGSGGGGSWGGRATSGGQFARGGAGAGGVAVVYMPATDIPGPVTVTVGAGGAGPAAQPVIGVVAGQPGGTSSFGSFVSITGGTGVPSAPPYQSGTPGAAGGVVTTSLGPGGVVIVSRNGPAGIAVSSGPEGGLISGHGGTGATTNYLYPFPSIIPTLEGNPGSPYPAPITTTILAGPGANSAGRSGPAPTPTPTTGASGDPSRIIIEEFY